MYQVYAVTKDNGVELGSFATCQNVQELDNVIEQWVHRAVACRNGDRVKVYKDGRLVKEYVYDRVWLEINVY